MDVRKLVVSLGVLIVLAVVAVMYLNVEPPPVRPRNNVALAERIEAQHGPALRAMGVRSLGVDPRSNDVVVVFANGGRLGRRVAARIPGPAGAGGCGELDVGVSVGDSLTAWGDTGGEAFQARLDCVIGEVLSRTAELRDPE